MPYLFVATQLHPYYMKLAPHAILPEVYPFAHDNPCHDGVSESINFTEVAAETTDITEVNHTDHRYRHLWMSSNNIIGTLPPELWLITSLKTLFLNKNELLTGPFPNVPTLMSKMTDLGGLYIALNDITGSLPTEIGLFSSSMEVIWASQNRWSGRLPTELGLLTDLSFLAVNDNRDVVTGELPSELGLLSSSLELLVLTGNTLTSTIPESIGSLTNLKCLLLNNNELTGSVAPEIWNLAQEAPLNWFKLADNPSLRGTIPTEWDLHAANLTQVELQNTNIVGTIPSSFCEEDALSEMLVVDCYDGAECSCGCACPEEPNMMGQSSTNSSGT